MNCNSSTIVFLLCCQFSCNLCSMSGNIGTVSNRKLSWATLLETIDNTYLARCAFMCMYETRCKSFSFSQKKRRCELYRLDSASAEGTGDIMEEDGVVLIDVDNWSQTRTGTCRNKPCDDRKVCIPDQQSIHCTEPNSSPCPDGWIKFEKKCYHFLFTLNTYTNATAYCEENGAKLAEPRTRSANEFLKTILRQQGLREGYWLGLTDEEVEGEWVWLSDGTRPDFYDWKGNDPNNGRYGNCALFWDSLGYGWGDGSCQYASKAVCEMV